MRALGERSDIIKRIHRGESVGALFDMGVYAVAALVAVLGTVKSVMGEAATLDKPTALEDAASFFALPWAEGLTSPGGPLSGDSPFYGLYEADGGWIALAALEPRFRQGLLDALGLEEASVEAFQAEFARRTPAEWERWAEEHDLPLSAVRLD